MTFTVYWWPAAETPLLASLLRAADKPALFAVVRDIDRRLRTNPTTEGESRDVDSRLLFVRPFCVFYSIDLDARAVNIELLRWVGM